MVDRLVDSVTPFCTQFSYQGQLDEFFDIDFNKIVVDSKILDETSSKKDKEFEKEEEKKKDPQRIYLRPEDIVFEKIKDFTLDESRHELSDSIKRFKQLTEQLSTDKSHETLAKAAKEKKYMKKYKQHLMLAMHVQSNLQKRTNFKLFEFEQVNKKSENFKKFIFCQKLNIWHLFLV